MIALGANLSGNAGPPAAALAAALALLPSEGLRLERVSRFFANPCFPLGTGPDYVNAAAILSATARRPDPHLILGSLHRIEERMGRARTTRWAGRTLDLDLVAIGEKTLPDRRGWAEWRALPLDRQRKETPRQLILPHPRLQDRAFVLVPLADIAADWRHPITRLSVQRMIADLPPEAIAGMVPL